MAKKSMWRWLSVMTAAAFALAIAGSAFAQVPLPPHQFFGSAASGSGAMLDGEAVADGTTITAWNQDGDMVGSDEVAGATWVIQIDPADADSVVFTIGDSAPNPSTEVVSGSLTELGLDLVTADMGDGDGDGDMGDGDMGDGDMGDGDGDAPDGLPATGTGGLAGGDSGLPVLPLILLVSVVLALGGVAVVRRTRA